MLVTLIAFLLVLGVLIFVHELGHFIAAKAVGIGVPRFSIGFGPPTPLRFQRGETEYRVSWVPLGGYVKMASKEELEAQESLEGGETAPDFPPDKFFESKPLWARILVISAGVIMNAMFAWVAYSAVAAVYGRVEDPTTKIASVDAQGLPSSASMLADLPFGAQIVRINGDTISSWNAVVRGIVDPTSPRLRIDFAGGLESAIIPIAGTQAEARFAIYESLNPLIAPRVGLLAPSGPAAEAGLQEGDLITSIDGEAIQSWDQLVEAVEAGVGQELQLEVQRDDARVLLSVIPEEQTVIDGDTGEERKVGRIGIGPWVVRVRYGLASAPIEGLRRTVEDGGLVWFALKGMVTGRVSPRELGGPILIGQVSGRFARLGPSALISFMAFLSINLAILNLLPIPVLDGGHLVFLFIEGIRGKPLSVAVRLRLTQVGLFVLLGIMVLALTNDLLRVIGG